MKQRPPTSFAFGRQVLHLRERAGLTQRALAQQLGISARAVLNWESGTSYPDPARLRQLIAVFVQQHAFPADDEIAAASALWNLAQTHAPRRVADLDHGWLTALIQSAPWSSARAVAYGADETPQGLVRHGRNDWEEAVAVPALHGRAAELALLERTITDDGCRLIAVLGIGGVGKTALVTTLAHRLAPAFDHVFWRSLWNAPPLDQLLGECIRSIGGATHPLPADLDGRLMQVLALLRQRRCLLVLDNLESLLQEGSLGGSFRAGYEAYGVFLAQLGVEPHKSCMLLTSREQPPGLAALAAPAAMTRTFRLGSLSPSAAQALLAEHGLLGNADAWDHLCARYSGNPLALKLAAAPIGELFGGDIAAFLAADAWLVNDVRQLLDEHLRRLAPYERTLLTWLAIAREPLGAAALIERLATPVSRSLVVNSIEGLHRRTLLERRENGALALQPVVLDYVTTRLLETLSAELSGGTLDTLGLYPLAQTTVPTYVRRSQLRVLVDPLLHHLQVMLGDDDAVRRLLDTTLVRLRRESFAAQGYASSNVVTLRARHGSDMRHYDLSCLALREIDFSAMYLQYANLSQAQITQGIFAEPFDTISSLACSPDGRLLASGAYNGDVRIWDLHGSTLHGQCRGHSGGVHSVAWSPDGTLLASAGSDTMIWLWEMPSGQRRGTFQGAGAPIRSLAWCPDGTRIAGAGSDAVIRIWDSHNGRCVQAVDAGSGDVYTLAWSPNGALLASGGSDQALRLWSAEELDCLDVLSEHEGTVFAVAFHPAGTLLASASYDGTVRVWDVGSRRCVRKLRAHADGAYALVWSPDGQLLASGGGDGTVRVWAWADGEVQQVLSEHQSAVYALAYHPQGALLLSGGSDRTIRVWETASGRCHRVLAGYANDVYALAFRPDGTQLVCGVADGPLRVWDPHSGDCQRVLVGHTGDVFALAWSPNGALLASGGHDAQVRLWAVDGSSCQLLRTRDTGIIYALAWHPGGELLAVGGVRIFMWSVQSGQVVRWLDGHANPVRALAWSPGGRLLASASYDGTVRVWDEACGAWCATLAGHSDFVYALAWSPDGCFLASGGYDRTVQVWDVGRSERVAVLDAHTSPVRTLAWSPDGALLASAGYDPSVVLWATDTWQPQVLTDHDSLVFSLAWSPDGGRLAVGRASGWISLWDRETRSVCGMLRCGRTYEGMQITGITGVSAEQRATLLQLGAMDGSAAESEAVGAELDHATEPLDL
jgi:WD40 repeat protein/transcriptional regulator with XRE-family HTH domain